MVKSESKPLSVVAATVPASEHVTFALRPKLRLQTHHVVKAPERVGGVCRVVEPSARSKYALQAAEFARRRATTPQDPKWGAKGRERLPRVLSPTEAFTRTLSALPRGEVEPEMYRGALRILAEEIEEDLDHTQRNWGQDEEDGEEAKVTGVGGFLSSVPRFGRPTGYMGGMQTELTGRFTADGGQPYHLGLVDWGTEHGPRVPRIPKVARADRLAHIRDICTRTSNYVGPGSYNLSSPRPRSAPVDVPSRSGTPRKWR